MFNLLYYSDSFHPPVCLSFWNLLSWLFWLGLLSTFNSGLLFSSFSRTFILRSISPTTARKEGKKGKIGSNFKEQKPSASKPTGYLPFIFLEKFFEFVFRWCSAPKYPNYHWRIFLKAWRIFLFSMLNIWNTADSRRK